MRADGETKKLIVNNENCFGSPIKNRELETFR